MTEEELARHNSKTLLQLLLSADARIEALTAERDRAEDELYELQQTCITLRGENEALTADRENRLADLRIIKAERDRLREALAFYADEENYKWYSAVDPCGCCSSWYEPKIHINGDDSGQIARAALKGESHD